jgi:hypothetical protein
VIVYLTLEEEVLETTPNHPFYTAEGEWVAAGVLQIGEQIRQADGQYGVVEGIEFVVAPQTMYNLTVATAHTYFVGDGQWLVHNTCNPYEVGTYRELKGKSDPGDGLDIHHVSQAHLASQVIPGYDYHNAPAIAVPRTEHVRIPKLRGDYQGTGYDLIRRDILNLGLYTKAPLDNQKELLELIKKMYPGEFE